MSGGTDAAGTPEAETETEPTEEAALQLTVTGISRLEDVAFSKTVKMKGHQWRSMLVRREANSKDVMGAYIQRVGSKPANPHWSIVIGASITLVNQVDPSKSWTKDFQHQYCRNSTDWGYSSFLRWKEVLNPSRGFVKDDAILLRARLVYPVPDAHTAPFSQPPTSQGRAPFLTRTSSSLSSSCSHIGQLPLPPLFPSSSQDSPSESSQLTPSSTSVFPPEMASFLSCSHCNEQYEAEGGRSPHTLHCGHSFCLCCLEKMAGGGKQDLTCPTCGKEHSVETAGSSRPWFPNLSVAQLVTSVLSKARNFCPTHQHDRNYYCLRDRVLVCIYCAYHGEHAGHHCQPASEARQSVRDELRPLRARAQGRVTEVERRLQLVRDEGEAAKTQAQTCAKMVEEYFSSLEVALQRQRDLLLRDLRTQSSSFHSNLETHITELERQQSKARRSLEEYEKWKAMPAREALASVSSITSSLQSTASASLLREGAVWLRVQVELPPSNPLSSLGPLGHVTVTCPSQASCATDSMNGTVDLTDQKSQEDGDTQPADDLVMDTREEGGGNGEAPGRRGLVKRTLTQDTSPEFELLTKKRRT